MPAAKRYWLMKTEPDVFSFEDLVQAPKKTSQWEGVRNYQARNLMRDDFKLGDNVFIYHSNTDEPGIYGTAKVVKEGYPDHFALDKKSEYFDPKSKEKGESRWVMVDVMAVERFDKPVLLKDLKSTKSLESMLVVQRGQRLSVQPVEKKHWDYIYKKGAPQSL